MEMQLEEKYEEILETIWKMSEKDVFSLERVKNKCTVDITDQDLGFLEKNKLINRKDENVFFTDSGRTIGKKIIRRHRLTKMLISSILKLKKAEMEEVACKVEHTLLPEVEESICTLLGHPEFCPGGKPIPQGECCGKRIQTLSHVVYRLDELAPGESGKLTFIKPSSHSQLHQLLSLGLNPGVVITVHRTSPAFCIKFENTELALDEDIAKNVFVLKTVVD